MRDSHPALGPPPPAVRGAQRACPGCAKRVGEQEAEEAERKQEHETGNGENQGRKREPEDEEDHAAEQSRRRPSEPVGEPEGRTPSSVIKK